MTTPSALAAVISATKEIGYAIGNSDIAYRLGFVATGCFTVSTMQGFNRPVAKSGHATRDAAITAARLMPEAWDLGFLAYNNDVAA